MMLVFGVGGYQLAEAGMVLLLAHAAFKAALFMVVGIVDHGAGTRDVRLLHGFGRNWRLVQIVAVISAASMAGIPPLLGFIAKEKALDGYVEHGDFVGAGAVLTVIVIASMLTFAYSARFVLGVFGIFINRRNVILMLMAIELILLAVNINLVAFSTFLNDIVGQVFALLVLTVAAAEAAIGLAILVIFFRRRGSIAVDDATRMHG